MLGNGRQSSRQERAVPGLGVLSSEGDRHQTRPFPWEVQETSGVETKALPSLRRGRAFPEK